MKYGLHGKLTAKEGQRDQLAEILQEAAAMVGESDGCHLYIVSLDSTDENSVWVTEVWENKEAHGEALKMENVRALIGQAMPLLEEMPNGGQQLSVLGGHGLS